MPYESSPVKGNESEQAQELQKGMIENELDLAHEEFDIGCDQGCFG